MAYNLILVQNFYLQMEAWGKNTIFFRADMNSSVHIDNKNKDILILGEGPMQELDYITLTPEAIYPINFTEPNKRFDLMFELVKKIFIGLLTDIVSASNHKNFVLLNNQKCMIQPTFINLHPNEYSQEFHCYQFAVKLDKCTGSCNTLNDLSNKV